MEEPLVFVAFFDFGTEKVEKVLFFVGFFDFVDEETLQTLRFPMRNHFFGVKK